MLSWRNISSPSRPRACSRAMARSRRPASSAALKCRAISSILQGDQRQAAAIAGLALQRGAAIAEEGLGLGEAVAAERGDSGEPEAAQPGDDVAGQVEQEVARPRRRPEEAAMALMLGQESGGELGAHPRGIP